MTTSKDIRKAIKELGYNQKQVSVKTGNGGYDTSFTVTIKEKGVNLESVKEAVKIFSQIDRCEVSGEILSGGNTYVFVEISWELQQQLIEENKLEAAEILAQLQSDEKGGVKSKDGAFTFFRHFGQQIKVHDTKTNFWTDQNIWMNVQSIALQLAEI